MSARASSEEEQEDEQGKEEEGGGRRMITGHDTTGVSDFFGLFIIYLFISLACKNKNKQHELVDTILLTALLFSHKKSLARQKESNMNLYH